MRLRRPGPKMFAGRSTQNCRVLLPIDPSVDRQRKSRLCADAFAGADSPSVCGAGGGPTGEADRTPPVSAGGARWPVGLIPEWVGIAIWKGEPEAGAATVDVGDQEA